MEQLTLSDLITEVRGQCLHFFFFFLEQTFQGKGFKTRAGKLLFMNQIWPTMVGGKNK